MSVEVFPYLRTGEAPSKRLLHVRGGVSNANPTRGGIRLVFSTSVEVFRLHWVQCSVAERLLHVRGGVSAP